VLKRARHAVALLSGRAQAPAYLPPLGYRSSDVTGDVTGDLIGCFMLDTEVLGSQERQLYRR